MEAPTVNGARAPRKSLAGQIDRLDVILDGLAEALNGAVADAVRDAVGEAVREAVGATVRELLSSPHLLRAALAAHGEVAEAAPGRPATGEEPPAPKGVALGALHAAKGMARQAASRAKAVAGAAWSWTLEKLRAAVGPAKAAVRSAWRSRGACAVAACAGAAVGAASYLAGPLAASLACGLAGAAAAGAASLLWPAWRTLRSPAS
jgi:hypothetical protein